MISVVHRPESPQSASAIRVLALLTLTWALIGPTAGVAEADACAYASVGPDGAQAVAVMRQPQLAHLPAVPAARAATPAHSHADTPRASVYADSPSRPHSDADAEAAEADPDAAPRATGSPAPTARAGDRNRPRRDRAPHRPPHPPRHRRPPRPRRGSRRPGRPRAPPRAR